LVIITESGRKNRKSSDEKYSHGGEIAGLIYIQAGLGRVGRSLLQNIRRKKTGFGTELRKYLSRDFLSEKEMAQCAKELPGQPGPLT
jgi:hypothetical protein